MARTKTRIFLTGVSAVAVVAAGSADFIASKAYAASPAQITGEAGEAGEAGEGMAPMAHEDAVAFALGLRALEADLNAGWAAANAGDMPAATGHFKAVLARLVSTQGDAMAEEGLERDHMADEIRGLIMVAEEAKAADDVRDLYEHGLHEVDEHIIGIDPLLRRDPTFVKTLVLLELRATASEARLANRENDAAAQRRAQAFAALARGEFGRVAVPFTQADAPRTAKAITALDEVIATSAARDVKATLSAISRAELALSGF